LIFTLYTLHEHGEGRFVPQPVIPHHILSAAVLLFDRSIAAGHFEKRNQPAGLPPRRKNQ
jgi:hypothetical protein